MPAILHPGLEYPVGPISIKGDTTCDHFNSPSFLGPISLPIRGIRSNGTPEISDPDTASSCSSEDGDVIPVPSILRVSPNGIDSSDASDTSDSSDNPIAAGTRSASKVRVRAKDILRRRQRTRRRITTPEDFSSRDKDQQGNQPDSLPCMAHLRSALNTLSPASLGRYTYTQNAVIVLTPRSEIFRRLNSGRNLLPSHVWMLQDTCKEAAANSENLGVLSTIESRLVMYTHWTAGSSIRLYVTLYITPSSDSEWVKRAYVRARAQKRMQTAVANVDASIHRMLTRAAGGPLDRAESHAITRPLVEAMSRAEAEAQFQARAGARIQQDVDMHNERDSGRRYAEDFEWFQTDDSEPLIVIHILKGKKNSHDLDDWSTNRNPDTLRFLGNEVERDLAEIKRGPWQQGGNLASLKGWIEEDTPWESTEYLDWRNESVQLDVDTDTESLYDGSENGQQGEEGNQEEQWWNKNNRGPLFGALLSVIVLDLVLLMF